MKMHAADPADGFCSYAIAQEMVKRGDHALAIEWYDKSLVADDASAYTYFHKARSLDELAMRSEAVEVVRQGVRVALAARDQHAVSELQGLLMEWDEIT